MLEQPPPGLPQYHQPPGSIPPPPKSALQLWLAFLIPLLLLIVWVVVIFVAEGSASNLGEGFFDFAFGLQILVTLAGWAFFSVYAARRFNGPSRVLLIVFYPIVQVGLQVAVFFGACLAAFTML